MSAARDDPFLWASLAALFFGLALGRALRALLPRGREAASGRRAAGRRARARRWTAFFALAALAVAAAAALLVLPPKDALRDAVLPWTAGAALVMGLAAGIWPLAAGLPALALLAGAFLSLRAGLAGYVPFRGPGMVASVLPFERGAEASGAVSFRVELELAERDSVPVAQELTLASATVSVAAEALVLGGPLGLAAKLARGGSRFYRIASLSGDLRRGFPPPSILVERLMPLGESEGLEPGGPAAERSALWGMARRLRSASEAVPLVVLEPVSFGLDDSLRPARILAR